MEKTCLKINIKEEQQKAHDIIKKQVANIKTIKTLTIAFFKVILYIFLLYLLITVHYLFIYA